MDFPAGIVEFATHYVDDYACARTLMALRFPDGFRCRRCDSPKFYWYNAKTLQCPNHHMNSLTVGTVMQKSKQSLLAWFWGAYFIGTHTPGISAVQFQKQAQLKNYSTAFNMLHKIRASLVPKRRELLKGVVEMDETFIQNQNQDRVIIIGAVEVADRAAGPKGRRKIDDIRPKVANRVRLRVIPNETAASFLKFARENVAKGSVILTDGDPSYNGLTAAGYEHVGKVQGKGKAAVYGLDHIHREFSNFKTWISGTHHDAVIPRHMQAYCAEFVFRHNRRRDPWAAFGRCLGLVTEAPNGIPTYKTLYRAGYEGGFVHPNPGTYSVAPRGASPKWTPANRRKS